MSLRILWWFVQSSGIFGYSVATREICTRMQKDEHYVTIASRYDCGIPHMEDGLRVFTGLDPSLVKLVEEEDKYDYVFYCLNETQEHEVSLNNWVACAAIDFEYLVKPLAERTKKSKFQFCVSEHNKKEFEKFGFKPYYCPWGVDTELFKPNFGMKEGMKEQKGWGKKFVIGTVGQNLPNDRKNHLNLLKAFKMFSERHDDAILYMHTSAFSGYPLYQIAIDLGIEKKVFFPDAKLFHMLALPYGMMASIYNSFDVCCIPTRGESFCLPFMEAQACGIPLITTATTSGPELMKGGWLIPVDEEDYQYIQCGSWQPVVRASKICAQLENAYTAWKQNSLEMSYGAKARQGALEFDWNKVYDKYWRSFLKVLEEAKK